MMGRYGPCLFSVFLFTQPKAQDTLLRALAVYGLFSWNALHVQVRLTVIAQVAACLWTPLDCIYLIGSLQNHCDI